MYNITTAQPVLSRTTTVTPWTQMARESDKRRTMLFTSLGGGLKILETTDVTGCSLIGKFRHQHTRSLPPIRTLLLRVRNKYGIWLDLIAEVKSLTSISQTRQQLSVMHARPFTTELLQLYVLHAQSHRRQGDNDSTADELTISLQCLQTTSKGHKNCDCHFNRYDRTHFKAVETLLARVRA